MTICCSVQKTSKYRRRKKKQNYQVSIIHLPFQQSNSKYLCDVSFQILLMPNIRLYPNGLSKKTKRENVLVNLNHISCFSLIQPYCPRKLLFQILMQWRKFNNMKIMTVLQLSDTIFWISSMNKLNSLTPCFNRISANRVFIHFVSLNVSQLFTWI